VHRHVGCTGRNSQKSAVRFFHMVLSVASCLLRICAYIRWLALVEILKSPLYSSFIWCLLVASCLVMIFV